MKFSNKPADIIKALCATAILLVSVNACTEVDDRLGASYLPQNQRMKVRVDTLLGTKTYLYKEDSLASSRLGYAYYGKEEDLTFGRRKNSFVIQFLPNSYPTSYSSGTSYKNYGINPIIDSVYIVLPLYEVHGDTTQVQTFNVYEIVYDPEEEQLSRDTTYYTSFPVDEYIDKGKPLFSFTHTGRRDVSTRLFPTEAGKNYLRDIVSMDMDDYFDDSLFLVKFKGLYITPTDGSPLSSAVYSSALASSGLMLYTRCHDTLDVTAIYDTIYSIFTFRDSDDSSSGYGTVAYNGTSINLVDFDYTGSALGSLYTSTNGFTDTLESSQTQKLMYVQSFGGVTGYLRFTDDMINTLRELQKENGVEHDILINQAMMYVWLQDGWNAATLNNSMKRLGSYTNLQTLTPIPDYQYYSEAYQQAQQDENYVLPYNGYLNRSNGYYQLDITSFVQQLAKGEPGDPNVINPVVNIAPEAYGFYRFGQSIVQGYDSDKPIKIKLTYTLIEED